MKKVLHIVLLLISFEISSQEEQSNTATLQETIDFINKYKGYIRGIYYGDGPVMVKNFKVSSFKLTTSKLIIVFRTNKNNYKHSIRINEGLPNALKKITEKNNNGFVIETVGKLYKNRISDAAGKRTWYTKRLGFIIPDDEMRHRIGNAFKHLIFLGKKDRNKKRDTTNEKF